MQSSRSGKYALLIAGVCLGMLAGGLLRLPWRLTFLVSLGAAGLVDCVVQLMPTWRFNIKLLFLATASMACLWSGMSIPYWHSEHYQPYRFVVRVVQAESDLPVVGRRVAVLTRVGERQRERVTDAAGKAVFLSTFAVSREFNMFGHREHLNLEHSLVAIDSPTTVLQRRLDECPWKQSESAIEFVFKVHE